MDYTFEFGCYHHLLCHNVYPPFSS
uniref:Uncharacterized protein n=1 Tax=Arundo donax TaxID=35708 RepID=A0A0A9B909_ARUDO